LFARLTRLVTGGMNNYPHVDARRERLWNSRARSGKKVGGELPPPSRGCRLDWSPDALTHRTDGTSLYSLRCSIGLPSTVRSAIPLRRAHRLRSFHDRASSRLRFEGPHILVRPEAPSQAARDGVAAILSTLRSAFGRRRYVSPFPHAALVATASFSAPVLPCSGTAHATTCFDADLLKKEYNSQVSRGACE